MAREPFSELYRFGEFWVKVGILHNESGVEGRGRKDGRLDDFCRLGRRVREEHTPHLNDLKPLPSLDVSMLNHPKNATGGVYASEGVVDVLLFRRVVGLVSGII